jgi:hypothetical protein
MPARLTARNPMFFGKLASRYQFACCVLGDQLNLESHFEGLSKIYSWVLRAI